MRMRYACRMLHAGVEAHFLLPLKVSRHDID